MEKTTQREFLERASRVHNSFYDYSQSVYTHSKVKVTIICPIHGVFKQTPRNHLQGQGCYTCGRVTTGLKVVKKLDQFILQATQLHEALYGYTRAIYYNDYTEVIVTCNVHGDFKIKPKDHLRKVGCKKCSYRGYSKKAFVDFCNNRRKNSCIFYVINVHNTLESFIKIGITSTTVKSRFRKLFKDSGYKYDLLYTLKDSPDKVWDIELLAKKVLSPYRYIPNNSYVGSSESFVVDSISNLKTLLKSMNYDTRSDESLTRKRTEGVIQ